MSTIYSVEELKTKIETREMLVVYYSNETCNVCKVLKPKIREMIEHQFPKSDFIYVDIEKSPVISGQFRVFSIPTVDIFIEGKELARFSRNITMFDFEHAIKRPYELLFPE